MPISGSTNPSDFVEWSYCRVGSLLIHELIHGLTDGWIWWSALNHEFALYFIRCLKFTKIGSSHAIRHDYSHDAWDSPGCQDTHRIQASLRLTAVLATEGGRVDWYETWPGHFSQQTQAKESHHKTQYLHYLKKSLSWQPWNKPHHFSENRALWAKCNNKHQKHSVGDTSNQQ